MFYNVRLLSVWRKARFRLISGTKKTKKELIEKVYRNIVLCLKRRRSKWPLERAKCINGKRRFSCSGAAVPELRINFHWFGEKSENKLFIFTTVIDKFYYRQRIHEGGRGFEYGTIFRVLILFGFGVAIGMAPENDFHTLHLLRS